MPEEIELDWQGYFSSFVEAHGEPVKFRGRLLFRDGWQYSATDYAGPEWRPPDDPKELAMMVAYYVGYRRKMLREELFDLQHFYNWLVQTQHQRDRPLLQLRVRTDENGSTKEESIPIDLEMIKARLDWLKEDIARCDNEMVVARETVNVGRSNRELVKSSD